MAGRSKFAGRYHAASPLKLPPPTAQTPVPPPPRRLGFGDSGRGEPGSGGFIPLALRGVSGREVAVEGAKMEGSDRGGAWSAAVVLRKRERGEVRARSHANTHKIGRAHV